MHAHIRRRKNAPRWRLLTTVMGYCLCTELQERGSFSHFPISPSRVRSARFHITADSKPRRREPGALKSPHSTRPASCAQHPCVVTYGQGEWKSTRPHGASRCFCYLVGDRKPRRSVSPGQASCLAQTEMRPVFFRPDLPLSLCPLAGNIKPRRCYYGGGPSAQISRSST